MNIKQIEKKLDHSYCYSLIPVRVVFVILAFLAFSLFYAYKAVLSVALVAMVENNDNDNATDSNENECRTGDETDDNPIVSGDLEWTSSQQANALAAFFYGGIVTQIPAGIFAARYGSKWIFGFSVLLAAVMSLLGPMAARTNYVLFFITRFAQGLADGVSFPCVMAMLSRWIPKMERSRAVATIMGCSAFGTIVTLPMTGYLCETDFLGGWPSSFYILGVVGVIWFALWVILYHETPASHPHITKKEYEYIVKDEIGELSSEVKSIPWKSIFTSIPVYAIIITHLGQQWGYNTVLTLLPTYLSKILHLDIKTNGLYSSLPYILNAILGLIISYVADKVRQTGKVEVNIIRKVNNTIGFIGPAICMIAVVRAKCNTTLSITFFTLSMALNGFTYSGIKSTHVDMSPDFAGTLMAITNTCAALSGILSPIIAAEFYSNGQTLTNWSYVFYLAAAIYCFSALVYIFFATARLQPWGKSIANKPEIEIKISFVSDHFKDI